MRASLMCHLAAGAAAMIAVVVLSVTASAGPPFRTDDPVPVDYQHFEMNFVSIGTETTGGWNGALPLYEVNYGALPGLQLHAIVPQDYTTLNGRGMGFAPGDLELGVKYRFIMPRDDDWFPQVGVFPTIELPVGNQKLGFSTGHAQIFLPIWLQKDFDQWTIYGGGGYWINPGFGNKNYVLVGVSLWRKVTDRFNLGIEVFHQTSSADGVPESTGFNVGTTYDFTEHWHLLGSVGTGIQNASETNQFSYYLGLQLTF
jgi:hypothetical protein